MGKLHVTILGLRNYKTNDLFGKGDPYVRVICAGHKYKTSVKAGENPTFNETFMFMIADPASEQIKFEVMDYDTMSDDLMGEYCLSLSNLKRGVADEEWHILHKNKVGTQIGVRLFAEDFGDIDEVRPPAAVPPPPPPPPVPAHHAHTTVPHVHIVHASYGGADVTALAHAGAHEGTFYVAPGQYNATFQDPFPCQYKDFAIVTVDTTVAPHTMRVQIKQEGESTHVHGGPHLSSARQQPHDVKQILCVNYGGRDLTAQCQAVFNATGALNMAQVASMGPDPMPGVLKAAVVFYETPGAGFPHRAATFWMDGEGHLGLTRS